MVNIEAMCEMFLEDLFNRCLVLLLGFRQSNFKSIGESESLVEYNMNYMDPIIYFFKQAVRPYNALGPVPLQHCS